MDLPLTPLAASFAKLNARQPISTPARDAFLGLKTARRTIEAHRDLVREGDEMTHCYFLERGYLSRSKMERNGGRQIVSFHVAGDLIDLSASMLVVADHTIRAHEKSTVSGVLATDVLSLAERFPEIGRAFWFETLIDASIFREWSLNVGRRTALERFAHLLLELGLRAEESAQGSRDDYPLPPTQTDLADAMGMTPVHVNRTVRVLRERGLVEIKHKRVRITNYSGLVNLAGFRPLYLHPEGPRRFAQGSASDATMDRPGMRSLGQ